MVQLRKERWCSMRLASTETVTATARPRFDRLEELDSR